MKRNPLLFSHLIIMVFVIIVINTLVSCAVNFATNGVSAVTVEQENKGLEMDLDCVCPEQKKATLEDGQNNAASETD